MKVLAVCGLGIGSSIILKINIGKVLDELGVKYYSLDVADIGTAQSVSFDMAITSVELAGILSDSLPEQERYRVIPISNFVDKDEMRTKAEAVLKRLGEI